MFGGERDFDSDEQIEFALSDATFNDIERPVMEEQSDNDEDFVLIRPPPTSDVSIQAESCGFISKKDFSTVSTHNIFLDVDDAPTASVVSSPFIDISSKSIVFEPAFDNSETISCLPVCQSSPKSQVNSRDEESVLNPFVFNPYAATLTSPQLHGHLGSTGGTFDCTKKIGEIITSDHAKIGDDEVSLPETEDDEPCALKEESGYEPVKDAKLVDAFDVNCSIAPFVEEQTGFKEYFRKQTDPCEEIKNQENKRTSENDAIASTNVGLQQHASTTHKEDLVSYQKVQWPSGGDNLDEVQQFIVEEVVNEDEHRVEYREASRDKHDPANFVPISIQEGIPSGSLSDIVPTSAGSLPNLIDFVEIFLSITKNECHKPLLQTMLSLTFLIKSRINDDKKRPEIVRKLNELTIHLKTQLGKH